MKKIEILQENVKSLEQQLREAWKRVEELKKVETTARNFIEAGTTAHDNEPWAGFTDASNKEKKAYVKLRDAVNDYEADQRS